MRDIITYTINNREISKDIKRSNNIINNNINFNINSISIVCKRIKFSELVKDNMEV